MREIFIPRFWFWIVGSDETRAWSGQTGSYVTEWNPNRVTRIATEEELSEVLRRYGMQGPYISADDIRAEAQRRIIALVGASDLQSCIIKQLNANMRANELNDLRHTRPLTKEETTEEEALRQLAANIKAIRARSNTLELAPPADFIADQHWS
ncbi:MAG: hypothetical protein ACM3L9_01895 [Deltaproteobacteria bacterium]